jgi:hypothetical protein
MPRDRLRQEADHRSCRNELELLLEVVRDRAALWMTTVRSRIDVVERVPLVGRAALNDHGIVGQVFDADLRTIGAGVVGRQSGDALVRLERQQLEPPGVYRQCDERDIDTAVMDDVDLIVPGDPVQPRVDARKLGGEAAQRGRDPLMPPETDVSVGRASALATQRRRAASAAASSMRPSSSSC